MGTGVVGYEHIWDSYGVIEWWLGDVILARCAHNAEDRYHMIRVKGYIPLGLFIHQPEARRGEQALRPIPTPAKRQIFL